MKDWYNYTYVENLGAGSRDYRNMAFIMWVQNIVAALGEEAKAEFVRLKNFKGEVFVVIANVSMPSLTDYVQGLSLYHYDYMTKEKIDPAAAVLKSLKWYAAHPVEG